MKAVFDTNILIDYLNGRKEAADELGRYRDLVISRLTWMEVLAGATKGDEEAAARHFLRLFAIEELTPEISEEAIEIRRGLRLRLHRRVVRLHRTGFGDRFPRADGFRVHPALRVL